MGNENTVEVRMITKDDFDMAVMEALKITMMHLEETEIGGAAAFLIPMVGMSFAVEVKKILFGEGDEE